MLFIQLTGLSGAGKTTISNYVKMKLESTNYMVKIVDGDSYRKTICNDLGFSRKDRYENIRRLAALAFGFTQIDIIILAVINPYEDIRYELKQKYNAKTIFINCPLETLILRDTKGLYSRSLLPDHDPAKLHNLTGINDVYDIPLDADLIINTENRSVEQSTEELYNFILSNISDRILEK